MSVLFLETLERVLDDDLVVVVVELEVFDALRCGAFILPVALVSWVAVVSLREAALAGEYGSKGS